MDIVIASNNKHKIEEIKSIIGDKFDNIYSLKDLNIEIDVEENGATFEENALIKAKAVSELTKMPALGDDSGLEVDFLCGAPGIYSARYSGAHGDDCANNDLLVKNLKNADNRRANFTCSVVIYYPSGEYLTATGKSYGKILLAPRGNNGFGYDPLFESVEYGLTYAELTSEQKNNISHRKKALKKLSEMI